MVVVCGGVRECVLVVRGESIKHTKQGIRSQRAARARGILRVSCGKSAALRIDRCKRSAQRCRTATRLWLSVRTDSSVPWGTDVVGGGQARRLVVVGYGDVPTLFEAVPKMSKPA